MDIGVLDLQVHKGEPEKPAFVFIHGLGMSHHIWTDPTEERMMGGMLSLRTLLREFMDDPTTLFLDVQKLGCTAITWSQQRPVGPVAEAEAELEAVLGVVSNIPCSSVVLVGHSRGGLIARALLGRLAGQSSIGRITGLVTICSPHAGSSLARWATIFSPVARAFRDALPETKRSAFMKSLDRSLGFIASTGAREMLPDSCFIRTLPSEAPPGVLCYSAGGTNPSLIGSSWLVLPEGLARLLPEGTVPEELMMNRGDALVSSRSSVLPYAKEHMDFHLNHLTILVDPAARTKILDLIKKDFLQA
ncbi:MAG: alpha/beta hydrolase [Thermodesulfovibrionales bacterium]|nr:alpha/beta hydrolase [Thermodesulfovibrionales bacterium]